MIKLTDNHGPRLLKMAPYNIAPALREALEEGADLIVDDAVFSIRDGAISGSKHVASLPGQAPNADTHDLDESIHRGRTIEGHDNIQTTVIADSDHAWYMERGTSKIEPRPFLAPATQRKRPSVIETIAQKLRDERR